MINYLIEPYLCSVKTADSYFIPLKLSAGASLPEHFTLMPGEIPHPLCTEAAKHLQHYLQTQHDWTHNFGLSGEQQGAVIGKMFGVLVVQNSSNETGYLAAFSGKLAGGNSHAMFVPPVFDALTEQSFLNTGMAELKHISEEIRQLEAEPIVKQEQLEQLKAKRRNHSIALQQQLFDHYHFLNRAGEEKNITALFTAAGYKNPPAGAGECAAPKLLQYAFQHNMKPLALAEFWWGQSPKSEQWKHGHFYPCCREKCGPILAHMLG